MNSNDTKCSICHDTNAPYVIHWTNRFGTLVYAFLCIVVHCQCITMHGSCFYDALRLCTNAQLCVQMHPSHWQCTICVCKLPRLLHTHVRDFSCIDTACKVGTLVSALLCIVVHCQCRFGTLVYAFLCIVVAVCNAFKCKAKQCIMSLNAPQCTAIVLVHCGTRVHSPNAL